MFGPLPGPGWEELFTSTVGNLTLYRLGPSVAWPLTAPGDLSGGSPVDGSTDAAANDPADLVL
jgi:hypothetical protein